MIARHDIHARRAAERGSAIIWAIVMMVIVAALVGAFSIVAQRTSERSVDASQRVSNAATAQTAVTRVTYAYQNSLGSESDYYVIDNADYRSMLAGVPNTKVYAPSGLPGLPADHATTFGVWERTDTGGGRLQLTQIGSLPTDTIVEEPRADGANAYWQIVRVIVPDTTGYATPNVVITLRSFQGSRQTRQYTKATYTTAEMRPGRFADFQLISDGNIRFAPGALINGPVHSNGLSDGSFATVPTKGMPNLGQSWVYGDGNISCTGRASISITSGNIAGGVNKNACNVQGATGQTISFLRAIESITDIEAAAGRRPEVRRFTANGRRGDETTTDPYDTAWRVHLNGNSMSVWYPDGGAYGTLPLRRVNAFAFDEDVRVQGTAAANVRVTIAARRNNGGAATAYISGDIRKGNDRTSAIGIIAEGNIVLWQDKGSACRVTTVQAALVAASGGITIPPSYTTAEINPTAPRCGQTLTLDGSFAGHRPPTTVWSWDASHEAGYTGRRTYSFDTELQRNPPPYFPLTGSWQPFNVRDANVDCLYARRTDATCT